jgi:hypothetical protein
MTWLPVDRGDLAERDAVLGLVREPYDVVREALELAWTMTDARLLDLCRLRLAQLLGTRAELANSDEETLAEFERWEESDAFGEADRAALAYAEQYHYDHNWLSDAQRLELARYLQPGATAGFVWALHMNDAYARVLTLLDIAPDPPGTPARPERTVGPGGSATKLPEINGRLNQAIVRQKLVDDVTSEAVRLHNADHQGCRY